MVDLTKGYISQAIFFSANAPDDRVRYRQEEAEAAFSALFNVQSQQTNIPDEFDPSAPRLIFYSGNKQFLISKNSTQLVLGFENAEKSIDQQMGIIVDNVERTYKRVEQFANATGEIGFVLNFNFPSLDSRSTLSEAVFNRFIKLPVLHDVASASLKVGFQTADKLFINFESDVYELSKADFQSLPGQKLEIDLSKLSFSERGFAYKVDINNKPRVGEFSDYRSELRHILSTMKSFMDDEFKKLAGF